MNKRLFCLGIIFGLSLSLVSLKMLKAQTTAMRMNSPVSLLITAIKNSGSEKEMPVAAQADGQELVLQITPSAEGSWGADLYDITGKQLVSDRFRVNSAIQYRISFAAYPEGIYMLRLMNDRSASGVFRVIKSSSHAAN